MKPGWKFISKVHDVFSGYNLKIEANIKSNLRRIFQKIQENRHDFGRLSLYTLTDMIRATVYVKDVEHAEQVYKLIQSIGGINIIRIRDKMCCSDLYIITMNFIFDNHIIGEF